MPGEIRERGIDEVIVLARPADARVGMEACEDRVAVKIGRQRLGIYGVMARVLKPVEDDRRGNGRQAGCDTGGGDQHWENKRVHGEVFEKQGRRMWKNIKKEKKGRSETTAITESNMSHVYPSVWIDAG